MQAKYSLYIRGDIKKASKEYGISQPTVKSYLSKTEEEIEAMDKPKKYERKKNAWLNEYSNIIYKMAADCHEPEVILNYILKYGYPGTLVSLSNLIMRTLHNNFGIILFNQWYVTHKYADTITVISRNEIIKYITEKEGTDAKKKVSPHIGKIKEKYPVVRQLDEIYTIFHHILMGNKEDELDVFIEYYMNSSVDKFVKGLKKDIHPAKNAISFHESSGFVEGNNNKFKLIKRILYGRSKLSNLFCKCYPAFLIGKDSFDMKKVLLNSK
ncbi:MAG: transposase, partial [Firmicutes bacterium]|nr:transposase [Bacillota bacterium]